MHLLADENIMGLDAVRSAGVRVTTLPGRKVDNTALRDVDVLWVRSITVVDEALLHDTPVKFVGTATAGTEHIDLDYLESAHIQFASAPGANANAVVEYVLAALLELREPWKILQTGSLGIIGCGHVGRRLATVATHLGWRTCVYDPLLTESATGLALSSLEEVLRCDVISIHCALTTDSPHASFHLIDEQQLATLSSAQTLINAARGPVINNQSLLRRLRAMSPPTVVLDVWEGEPFFDQQLLQCPSLRLATPHIAGYSVDAKLKATQMLVAASFPSDLSLAINTLLMMGIAPDHHEASASTEQKPSVSASDLVQRYYPICRDDIAFRAIADSPQPEAAKKFDQLRRDYPLRREVASNALHNVSLLSEDALRLSQALSF